MFFNDWKVTYQSSMVSSNAPDPTYNGLMIYDAMGIYIAAAKLIQGSITGDGVRNAFATLGKGNVPAYQGLSGRIMFDDKGDPVDKALVILTVQQGQNGNAIVIQQVLGRFS
jgi:ABC-type branched-subunit amino acid transport system substrate-binding protein